MNRPNIIQLPRRESRRIAARARGEAAGFQVPGSRNNDDHYPEYVRLLVAWRDFLFSIFGLFHAPPPNPSARKPSIRSD